MVAEERDLRPIPVLDFCLFSWDLPPQARAMAAWAQMWPVQAFRDIGQVTQPFQPHFPHLQ